MTDWNALRYLLAIARGGSLAAAARTLGVNHSTVFRRLNAFEQALGVRLFERLPEGYVLTAAGERVRQHAEQAEAALLALERAAAGGDYRLSGDIRMTTAANLAHDYVAPAVAAFRERYPDIRVEIAVSDHDFDLNRREADLALRATAQPPEFLVGRRIATLRWHVCASSAYLQRHGRPRDVDELARHAQIGADAGFARIGVFAWQRRAVPPERIVVRANELNTMAALAEAGVGLALLPSDQVRPGLVRLFALDAAFDGALWLLTHPDLRHAARIRAFADFLHEQLRADPRLADASPAPVPTREHRPARPRGH